MAKQVFGKTWWGEQWVDAFKCMDYNQRMSKGHEFARLGLVKNLNLEKNVFTARLELGRYDPIDVKLTFQIFTEPQKKKIVDRIAKVPALLSDLQNRKLPTNLMFFCNKHRIKLFPNEWYDIEAEDSSPFARIPSEFMTAVIWLIGGEIDKNPFLVFEMHDFDVFAELEKQGHMIGAKKEREILNATNFWAPKNKQPDENIKPKYEHVDVTKIPDLLDGIFTLLSEKPIFYTRKDFRSLLKKTYKETTKHLNKYLKKYTPEETLGFDKIDQVQVIANTNFTISHIDLIDNQGEIISFPTLNAFFDWLKGIPSIELFKSILEIRALSSMHLYCQKLLQKSAYTPQLYKIEDGYKIRWLPALMNEIVKNTFQKIAAQLTEPVLFFEVNGELKRAVQKDQPLLLCSLFLNSLISTHSYDEDYMGVAMMDFFFHEDIMQFDAFDNKEFPDIISLWLNRFYIGEKSLVPLIKVEDVDGGFELSLFIEKRKEPDFPPISLASLFKEPTFKDIKFEALKEVMQIVEFFPEVKKIIDSEGTEKLLYNSNEFANVLYRTLPAIRMFGIRILLPKGMTEMMKPKLSMKLSAENPNVENFSMVGMAGLMDFDWQVALGDTVMNPDDFLSLVQEQSGIIKVNDEYIFVDEEEVSDLIGQLHKMPTELGVEDLLQVALSEEYEGAAIEMDAEAQTLMQNMLEGEPVAVPEGLKATLRPYQERGYQWMYKNARIGFGSLIADDMGLGKTLQVITTLLKFKQTGVLDKEKAIVIVPTTLLTNWEKEIKKFAPSLSTFVYHGAKVELPEVLPDVVITTYGLIRNHLAKITAINWKVLIIDEAQNIKNPNTSQTKAIKKVKAEIKIAMSGTPVENRLSEYWSIFDFTNKGYLGTLREFKNGFARPIEVERDQKQLDRFRKITSPFILRRVKSDKSIIKDLPEKIEMDQYCGLTKEQTAIYQGVVEEIMNEVENTEGIGRKGQVLRLITALKQICNHPANYLKQGGKETLLSGKGQMAMDIVDKIIQSQEKVLIFTQYREMGDILSEQFEQELGLNVPFLHGGLSRKKRDEMVQDFQEKDNIRAMVLSLKAAGTGLNLTAANNIIHYDMWWNPAVEAQATDRAYRIGQTKNVVVHRLMTKDTFEEKINFLLQDKKELANLTVSNGEQWIGDLSNEDLKQLVKLD